MRANAGEHSPLVLVVDDEVAARELLSTYLAPRYRIATADSSADAIQKAKQLPFSMRPEFQSHSLFP
jgi:CheY-like chemotaxis protein